MVSLYKISEKCAVILEKSDPQSLISAVQDAYATVAKMQWYENRADGCQETEGSFLYTFGKVTPLIPILDLQTDEYYIVIPSSYLRLPHEIGINSVSCLKDRKDFIRITSSAIWNGLKASVLGGRQTYRVEGVRMYFPKMTSSDMCGCGLLLKMAIALDTVDSRENLNISPDIQDKIVQMVVAKFAPQVKPIPENL